MDSLDDRGETSSRPCLLLDQGLIDLHERTSRQRVPQGRIAHGKAESRIEERFLDRGTFRNVHIDKVEVGLATFDRRFDNTGTDGPVTAARPPERFGERSINAVLRKRQDWVNKDGHPEDGQFERDGNNFHDIDGESSVSFPARPAPLHKVEKKLPDFLR